MALTPCDICSCIPGNILKDTFKQNTLVVLCGILTSIGNLSLSGLTPVSQTDGAATNNTIYFSTTNSKLSYKDAGGVVHALY